MTMSSTELLSTGAKPALPSPVLFVDPLGEEPICGELFGLEHLEAHARRLAAASAVGPVRRVGPLLSRFADNGKVLVRSLQVITEAYRRREAIGSDAEWLLDNFHIVSEALREIQVDLPRGYYEELPKLVGTPLAGYPRVYALALGLIAHTDSCLDEAQVVHYVQAYQTVVPLTIGEIWAVPTMLRLGLVENLRRLAEQMLRAWNDRRAAEALAGVHRRDAETNAARADGQRIEEGHGPPGPEGQAEEHQPEAPARVGTSHLHGQHEFASQAARYARRGLTDPFIVHLLQALRDLGPAATAGVEWLERQLAERNTTTTEVFRRENRRQAANQVSVGNCVTSIRLLAVLDWNAIFEKTSLVEAVLRDDPTGTYARQDFATRDRYRRTIEKLSRASGLDELDVARRALMKARTGATIPPGSPPAPGSGADRKGHVGYYLIDEGRRRLEDDLRAASRYRPHGRDRLLDFILRHAGAFYFGAVAAVTSLLAGGLLAYLAARGAGWGWLVLALAVVLLPASELAVGLVNYLVTLVLPPRVLPKLDFKEGIPADCATFVVMPTMLLRIASAASLLERLEIHYLSNPDPNLRFALLTDFADAPAEHMPEDDAFLRAALDGVKALNERYAAGGPDRFFLFHRRRLWNSGQGCWMGWERKRGKLSEFNRLLRGARDTSYTVATGDPSALPPIRFVITLDADTRLPRETARRLVGTLAHPLNRPVLDPARGRVVEGYGILQPRVSLRLTAVTRSWFSRIFAGSAGIDPYTTAVSDVYQDLFASGSFTGKGIYDVDAFEAAVGHTFPDNCVLSHDLIEGTYARCGLVTDIELLDDFPSRYHAYARREHRWARGDWQISPWLFRTVPAPGHDKVTRWQVDTVTPEGLHASPVTASPDHRVTVASQDGARRPNPLPLLERWKIFDNLRRSLVPPALMVLLALGWTVLPGSPWVWTAIALIVLGLPVLLQCLGSVFQLLGGVPWLPCLRGLRGDLPSTGGQVLLSVAFLAEQARLLVDAIVRTLVRMGITRKHLLEWETAAATERRLGTGFGHFCLSMWPASVVAVLIGLAVFLLHPSALPAASPFLFAWLISPAVAFWVSRPPRRSEVPLNEQERRELRRVARRTWSFFETFVGDEDHWLPPDNYQEDPKGVVAHRTSPTNMGLLALSTLAAHDFGYLSLAALVGRLEKTFTTFDRLERYRGHFYNWYDTRNLHPLLPAYVSTVDSGNFMGCLLALKQGLREKVEEPVPGPAVREGLADTVRLVSDALRELESSRRDGVARPAPSAAGAAVAAGGETKLQAGASGDILAALQTTVDHLGRVLEETPTDLLGWDEWFGLLEKQAVELPPQTETLAGAIGEAPEELQGWAQRLAEQVRDRRRELKALYPWLDVLREIDGTAPTAGAEFPSGWADLRRTLASPASIAELHAQMEALLDEVAKASTSQPGTEYSVLRTPSSPPGTPSLQDLLNVLAARLRDSTAGDLLARCQQLADQAGVLAGDMDFTFLYNQQRRLFATGYNLTAGRLDNSHYDLLASEACLTSFLAVAHGDADKRHWFQLGRPLTRAGGTMVLLSWGGTMFEYLMPRLLLPSYPGTLLDESRRGAVDRQIEYGRQSRVPWGLSESAFSALDGALDYQYQSFGVPGLGLKRGLAQDLVVAPYATALALMVRPRAALTNLRALAAAGAEGSYGFYEAVDYTRDRLLKKRRSLMVRCFMAHHQGMSLVALANCLLDNLMPRRFRAEPMVRATELLLQERTPRSAPLVNPHSDETASAHPALLSQDLVSRRLTTPNTPVPRTHLLSNGHYTVMLTNAGAGYSSWHGLDVTRWREDRTRDAWGQFCYLRDLRSGLLWSAGHQPVGRGADEYEVTFAADKAEFRRLDAGIETLLEVTVSPENFAEVRRVTVTNHNNRTHDLELTSYAEVVLAPHTADLAHPAFGKLFLETELIPEAEALLCRRRPRSQEQRPVFAVHVMAVDGHTVGGLQHETDRARFLGRGRTPARPAALDPGAVLSGTTGPVLDPVLSLRRRVRLQPGASASVTFTTAAADTREEAVALAGQYHDLRAVTRAFELAWAHSQVELRHLHLAAQDVQLFQRLAAPILYSGTALRAPANVLAANHQGQPGLWRHGISGDRPIVLARVSEEEELALVRQLLVAHTYWRLKGLEVDLVILNEHATSYFEELHHQLQSLVRASDAHLLMDKPGGVFLRKAAHMSEDDKVLLQAAARILLVASRGSLSAQLEQTERARPMPARLLVTREARQGRRSEGAPRRRAEVAPQPVADAAERRDLLFANGFGGFSPDGREYVILSGAGSADGKTPQAAPPPAPWINVVANPTFGFLVSESGAGYTWAGNSQTNRLTPWNNDPVSDPPGEAIYLRDEETGEFWTPTPLPAGAPATGTTCRHGQGYSIFESHGRGLFQELLLFVPPDDPVKVIRLKVRNAGGRPRRLSATLYAEWVLGTVRDQAPMNVITEIDPDSEAVLARNAFNQDFAGHVAFADVNLRPRTVTADRTEFLGRNGTPAAPAALGRVELSGRAGAGFDPCAAIQVKFDLRPGADKEIVFFLGQAPGVEEARRLLRRLKEPAPIQAGYQSWVASGQSASGSQALEPDPVQRALDGARARWEQVLTAVQVRTPNPAFDLLVNRWLLYQVLSCRVWARSALYQSGGAYGFRDQLQDVMALVHAAPAEARAHILRAAARQFPEGDVQHWWHPPLGKGVRTRISDDFLWLPFVVAHYVSATGDAAILDERIPYLKGHPLKPDQEEDYSQPDASEQIDTLHEHCVRALEHGCRFGAHGLPLMGTGDWNDGMNRVGAGGKGESVWDAWFLIACLTRFADLCGPADERARAFRERAEAVRRAVEENAWDGRWYRRAYFDDGTPLGSQQNDECKIDSIAQSWAVLSGAGAPDRSRQAMSAVDEFLVRQADRLILLFTPPFDRGSLEPGYIKGYVPGIRENGGQYTHAATWVVQATALLGNGSRAVELFDLLNPIRHAATAEQVNRYRVEPYVVAADVYGAPPHTGRGGWTWYTGSASWLYRVALEAILGFHATGNRLSLDPHITALWPGFEITYRHRSSTYHIHVANPHGVEQGVTRVTVDGREVPDGLIDLADDGATHEVSVTLG